MTNNNNQQNQRVSPFSRTNNNNANTNAANTTNNNSRFGGSRFGANNTNTANNNQNTNNSLGAGSRLNRFGQQTVNWTVAPMTDAVIRISLDGLGDPFHRLMGTPLNIEFGDPQKVVEALQGDDELREKLGKILDEAWESYQFRGAALLFPWDEDVRKAYSQAVHPNNDFLNTNQNNNQPAQNNNQNNVNNNQANQNANQNFDDNADWLDALTDSRRQDVTCLRAIDLAFVLNVLARSRANVIVGNTPLALEPGFLAQTVICDDPRIVTIARATGCIDENW